MANQEQVNLIKQGGSNWNTWREKHSTEIIDLSGADLREADLREANLSYANFNFTDLSYANLRSAHLIGADLRSAHLIGADLSNANLNGAFLSSIHTSFIIDSTDYRGILKSAILSGANLSAAYLHNVNLGGVNLDQADLTGAAFEATSFGDRDLRVIKGLETIRHWGPSPLSINTIYLSQGDIPEMFVRGTGAPDSFLEYMKALASKPIEYYSCFISYSSHNEDFARRLHADLQNQNVRCWFAPHDMRIGDEIRSRIDESIRIHDKLLLILSQHAIESTWIQKEVETAFEQEQRQHRLILFPIKLDETVMHTHTSWAADIRRMRHIGDFQRWKDYDKYEQSFTRLLRDLKAESNT